MGRRFQFSLRALLVLMLAVACFFAGVRFERERKRLEAEAAALATATHGTPLPAVPITIDLAFPPAGRPQ
jgi:hypothetical protein